jgi:hypothetical protein
MGMSEVLNLLDWLEQWYQQQWDDELEQDLGFKIQTLDNPGWLVEADLRGLEPEAGAIDRVLVVVGDPPCDENGNIGGTTWMTCEIRSGKFLGAGDLTQLRTILAQFRSFVEPEAS